MRTQTRASPERSQRDELERLQDEWRDARRRREDLSRENAELASEVARLEQEVRASRQTVEEARTGAERPARSLPDRLVPPFHALPSRRTPYGQLRFALRGRQVGPLLFLIQMGVSGRSRRLAVCAMFLLLCLGLAYLLQGPEDDESPAWSFGEEGFASAREGVARDRVLYSEMKKIEVRQGWLERLFGFGSVRVTWTPGAATSQGKAAGSSDRTVDIDLLDEPRRLADWLQARASGKEAERVG